MMRRTLRSRQDRVVAASSDQVRDERVGPAPEPVRSASSRAQIRAPTFGWEPRVLVVDDDPVSQFAAVSLLERLGFGVDVAADGREALEVTAGWPYVAVLMDCSMPDVDGYTAARQIARRDGLTRHTLVIAMTSHPRTVCLASGMDFHMAKPLRIDELRTDFARLGLLAAPVGRLSEVVMTLGDDTPLLKLPGVGSVGGSPVASPQAALTALQRAVFALPELWRAANARDCSMLRRVADEIGPRAAVVGAVRVAFLCGEMGKAAAQGQGAAAAGIEPLLRRALADTEVAMRSWVASAASREAPTGKSDGDARVAIADDDPLARFAIETMVGAADGIALVGSAEGVDEIVGLAVAKRPDVVVLDWLMPGGGGPEAARRILSLVPDVRIIALTSSDGAEAAFEMTRAGACAVLVKGGSPEKFLRTIRGALVPA
jgi:CheY-like chemotaxis protein